VPVLIAASASRTCLGDGAQTFAAILRGACGATRLHRHPVESLNVHHGYPIDDREGPDAPEGRLRASGWLAGCIAEAVRASGVDPRRARVPVLVGTGLRELRAVEQWAVEGTALHPDELHFSGAVSRAVPGLDGAVTLANACSAAGYALALGQDLVELGEADAVVVAGADGVTRSMLAMIGRFADRSADRVRPFDAERPGVLLGEGAAAVVLVPDGPRAGSRAAAQRESPPPPLGRLLATGLSCDARHETAPDAAGIRRAVLDALTRAGRGPGDVDLVLAHGTGTELNDPTEAAVLGEVFAAASPGPLVTAVKGAVGHTSGASALTSLDVGLRAMASGLVPPVTGLRTPLAEAGALRLVRGRPVPARTRLLQVDAFGFGGVNAVSLVEALG
jgi:3-oxoacyl-[acyl-carrier-protein] synthase II